MRSESWLLLALATPLASAAVLLKPAPTLSRPPHRPAVRPYRELGLASPPPGSGGQSDEEQGGPTPIPDLSTGPLRAHQLDARDRILSHWNDGGRRCTVVMPGGSGKTVCGLSVAEAAMARSRSTSPLVIVAVPSLELITQTAREWGRWRSPSSEWVEIKVRSGSDSGGDQPTTTDVSEIRGLLADGAARGRPVVVYSTYNSLDRVGEAMGEREADLVIFDEAHRTAGRPDKFAAFGLEDARLRASFRLFMTATPRRFERSVGTGALRVLSMDDEQVYGPVRARCRAPARSPRVAAPLRRRVSRCRRKCTVSGTRRRWRGA